MRNKMLTTVVEGLLTQLPASLLTAALTALAVGATKWWRERSK